MPEPEKGWRGLADDAQRVYFVLGLVAAAVAATWAGTYWGWWAYMWDVALPIRVVGILAISASAFVLWYGLLFTCYSYYRWPKRNPLVPVKSREDEIAGGLDLSVIENEEGGLCRLLVTNRGKTDTFSARFEIHELWGQDVFPSPWLRWDHSDTEKLEIISGQDAWLNVARVNHFKDPVAPTNRFRLTSVQIITPKGDAAIPAKWDTPDKHLAPLVIHVSIVSVLDGRKKTLECFINAATLGDKPPSVHWLIRPYPYYG